MNGNNHDKYKVVLVTQYPYDKYTPHGGVEAVSVNLASALSMFTEFEIHVLTLSNDIDELEITKDDCLTIHRLPKSKGSELFTAIGIHRKILASYLDTLNPDIIHLHDTYGIMLKNYSCPKVFTIHGFIYGDTLLSNTKLPWLRSKIWEYYEKSNWAQQPNIISISPYVRERLAGISNGMIYDIENPIDGCFFNISHNEQPGVIFSSAVISPRKNTLMLIKAIKLLLNEGLDVKLRLAGPVVNPGYGNKIKLFIDEHKLHDSITFLGKISSEEIKAELSRASIYALASLEENAPMGIEEAMAVGLPVIASNRCGMPYMVRHFETGFLIDPFDEKNIAKKIKSLVIDDKLRKKLGDAGKLYASSHYHSSVVASRTRSVYLDILKSEF